MSNPRLLPPATLTKVLVAVAVICVPHIAFVANVYDSPFEQNATMGDTQK